MIIIIGCQDTDEVGQSLQGTANSLSGKCEYHKIVLAAEFLQTRLKEKHVQMRADKEAMYADAGAVAATEEDWGTEYLEYILSIKVVYSLDEAIALSTVQYRTFWAIITNDYTNAQKLPGMKVECSGGICQCF